MFIKLCRRRPDALYRCCAGAAASAVSQPHCCRIRLRRALAVTAPPIHLSLPRQRDSSAAAFVGTMIAAAAHAPPRPPSSSHIRRRCAAMSAVERDSGVAASDTRSQPPHYRLRAVSHPARACHHCASEHVSAMPPHSHAAHSLMSPTPHARCAAALPSPLPHVAISHTHHDPG